jgi:hypothetical protein
MPNILDIVQHTPWWVFPLLAVLVVFGVQALKERKLPLWRLLLIPAVFIAWGATSLVQQVGSSLLFADWLMSALIGGAIGWGTSRDDQFRLEESGLMAVKGSALPLVRNLMIFAAKYGLTAAVTIDPMRRAILAPWDIAVSGLAAGYFVGWLIRLACAYRHGYRDGRAIQP